MGIKCQVSEEKSGKVHVKKQLTPVFLMSATCSHALKDTEHRQAVRHNFRPRGVSTRSVLPRWRFTTFSQVPPNFARASIRNSQLAQSTLDAGTNHRNALRVISTIHLLSHLAYNGGFLESVRSSSQPMRDATLTTGSALKTTTPFFSIARCNISGNTEVVPTARKSCPMVL